MPKPVDDLHIDSHDGIPGEEFFAAHLRYEMAVSTTAAAGGHDGMPLMITEVGRWPHSDEQEDRGTVHGKA